MLKTQHDTKFTEPCCYTGQTALIKLFDLRFHLKPMSILAVAFSGHGVQPLMKLSTLPMYNSITYVTW